MIQPNLYHYVRDDRGRGPAMNKACRANHGHRGSPHGRGMERCERPAVGGPMSDRGMVHR